MKKPKVITIDGPAASGKTTVARLLAKTLGYSLLESGAFYRLVTCLLLKHNFYEDFISKKLDPKDTLEKIFSSVTVKLTPEATQIFYEGKEINHELREIQVEERVSVVAAIPEVREFITGFLRRLVDHRLVVAEGRDMGSVVFKEAELKVFLTADEQVRAERRYKEKVEKEVLHYGTVIDNLKKRDQLDSTRKVAPLTIPEEALVLDTSNLSPEEVLQKILSHLENLEKA
ncbi:(d)CMP kinase [Thermodesulfobacterium sp. TA1]|uniref:(d)CMP kinase n=1 Tax=Thermodesulfobacterium sp. TA1 TaxID=2234087 RepID=UPI0012318C3F|nr:(d)CMP kinase [Thermodesulfobacterium sp. TA1]QER41962.1 (d)CMP kinase [Thermodesulfobacterium sp. TA1]